MLYLVRHGQADTPPNTCIGQTNIPLTEKGIQQILHDTLPTLRELKLQHPLLLSSPLLRTMQSATIISEELTIPLKKHAAFQEINMGAWDGLSFSEIQQRWPDQYEARGKNFSTFRPPYGESFSDLQQRVVGAFHPFFNEARPIIIVTHAGVIRTLLCTVHKNPLQNLFDYSPSNGSITAIDKKLL